MYWVYIHWSIDSSILYEFIYDVPSYTQSDYNGAR